MSQSVKSHKVLSDDWEFGVCGVYNYKRPGQFSTFFDFIKRNHTKLPGDIVEAGVYQGKSLIALGLLLRELGSDKKVYGYDSFSGFPPVYHPNDSFNVFEDLIKAGKISLEHYERVQSNQAYKSYFTNETVTVKNISGSGDFSGTSLELVQKKIDLFELDNIVLIPGSFEESMKVSAFKPRQVMAVLMDCDLYESYRITFNYVWALLCPGGMIYLDEYYSLKFPGARIATDEFITEKNNQVSLQKMQSDFADFERWYLLKN